MKFSKTSRNDSETFPTRTTWPTRSKIHIIPYTLW
jgi:hypothetical protein